MPPEDDEIEDESEDDPVWDKVQGIEDEIFDEVQRLQDKYNVPINVVARLAASVASRLEALGYLYAEDKDRKHEDFDPERN